MEKLAVFDQIIAEVDQLVEGFMPISTSEADVFFKIDLLQTISRMFMLFTKNPACLLLFERAISLLHKHYSSKK